MSKITPRGAVKLEPCPECRDEDVTLKSALIHARHITFDSNGDYESDETELEYMVVCDTCDAFSTPSDDPDETVDWWNGYCKEQYEKEREG